MRYILAVAIQSFADKVAERFFRTGQMTTGLAWGSVSTIARRKLDMLHYAVKLQDLRSPPGNRLEALKGDLRGYYSIRVNDQWRILFEWTEQGPSRVRIVDYH